jgi:hypothetical protein
VNSNRCNCAAITAEAEERFRMSLIAQSILYLPRKTVQWRRTIADRHADDPRNERAADWLERILDEGEDSVSPETWQALEGHVGTIRLRTAINETSRTVGFSFYPRNLNEYFAAVIAALNTTIH